MGPTQGPTEVPTACVSILSEWIGDNCCDDPNNNPECEFDGGDCCQEEPANGWDGYCSDCLCIELPETTEAPIECVGVNQWIGDNYCDDVNNNPECDFDGGDCCQEAPANGWDQYCEDCECFDMPETTEPPMETTEEPMDDCLGPHRSKDNYCDDQNNNPECDFDGGDCCQDEAAEGWNQYCNDCLCLEMPETTEGPAECPDEWIGDNYCDDVCNNDDNDFDGGDCSTEGPTGGPSDCFNLWIGDNYCDDQCNNDDNDFDG